MKRTAIMVFIALLMTAGAAAAGGWDLVRNVKRLERVKPDYKKDKDIDKKFLDLLALTEKTRAEAAVYDALKRIPAITTLAHSKYMDSFLYYVFIRSYAMAKSGSDEPDYWLQLLRAQETSPHLLAAELVRLRHHSKSSQGYRENVQRLVDWIKARKTTMKVRPPEYTGNILLGHKPRWNFADGPPLKLYTLSYYLATVTPPRGFLEDDTYVSLLSRIKDGREDVLAEMAGIYRKMGKRTEASESLYELALLKAGAKEYEAAKKTLDDAVRLNPKNSAAVKERDRIKLELTYQSLAPAPPVSTEEQEAGGAAETAPGIPDHLRSAEGYLVPSDTVMNASDLEGKSKAELRVMRNEVFARHGRIFRSPDLDAFFSGKSWYNRNASYSDELLTDVDRANVRIIQEAEELAK